MIVKFNKPYRTPETLNYIADVFNRGVSSGDGHYTKKCHRWLEEELNTPKALLTHSCTAALEMAAILLEIESGDEVIMPSYTFVSTANAFVLRGAVPVFIDVRKDNFNIDESQIVRAINEKTKAIVVVHYAGVACDMDQIMNIASEYDLAVVEDAAQAVGSFYKGRALGSIGHMGALSFHETKNIVSGEGGALLVNDSKLIPRAEIIREKGTNRSQFFRGVTDKYTWVDIGSSYLPSDIIASYLYSGLEMADDIKRKRLSVWHKYYQALIRYETLTGLKLPIKPDDETHNAHMFYLVFPKYDMRDAFIDFMKERGIMTPFHYVPLHSSPAGEKYTRVGSASMANTISVSHNLARLPLYYDISDEEIAYVIRSACDFLDSLL